MSSASSSTVDGGVGLSRYGQSLNQGHGGSSEGSLALREERKLEIETKKTT